VAFFNGHEVRRTLAAMNGLVFLRQSSLAGLVSKSSIRRGKLDTDHAGGGLHKYWRKYIYIYLAEFHKHCMSDSVGVIAGNDGDIIQGIHEMIVQGARTTKADTNLSPGNETTLTPKHLIFSPQHIKTKILKTQFIFAAGR
jgi:hypothetical protein